MNLKALLVKDARHKRQHTHWMISSMEDGGKAGDRMMESRSGGWGHWRNARGS